MNFPQLIPTARSFKPGGFPVKSYRAQNGAEVRILYGDKRSGMTMSLTYSNISDEEAEAFLDHYHSVRGTFETFILGDTANPGQPGAKGGWAGTGDAIGAEVWGSAWRYEGEPQLDSVYPGVSTVQVQLIGAMS